ncbi:MAG: putative glycoside hydrolase [Nitriliruptorales bacterium]|nr:putative glycoside hydrolase [Nitriliruptorales bacterium]
MNPFPKAIASLVVVTLLVVGCTSSDGTDDATASPDPTSTVGSAPSPSPPPTAEELRRAHLQQRRDEFPIIRGLYSTMHSFWGEKWDHLVGLVANTEINALVVDVREEQGNVAWPMNIDGLEPPVPGAFWESPAEGLAELLDAGGYAIARIVCMKDSWLAEQRPDLTITNLATGGPLVGRDGWTWLDPWSLDVWEYCGAIGAEAIRAGFDEVQFDYVRFPNGGDADVSQLRFTHAPEGTPQERVQDPTAIWRGLSRAAELVRAEGGFVSADLFGLTLYNYEWNVDGTGQVWEELAMVMDTLSPMVYPSHYGPLNFGLDPHPVQYPYETILGAMEEAQVRTQGLKATIRPWLEDFGSPWMGSLSPPHSPERVRQQIQAVYDKGIESWLLWNAVNRFSEEIFEDELVPRASEWVRDPDQIPGSGQAGIGIRQLPLGPDGRVIVPSPEPSPSPAATDDPSEAGSSEPSP